MNAVAWADLPEEALLELKISTLGLSLPGTELQPLVEQLYTDLAQKGLTFRPPCFVGDEWFVPVGIPAIAIPFFLVHPRLRELERKLVLEVEGDTRAEFLRLIRHEAGHAYAYAYRLTRRKKWQAQFGLSSNEDTPSTYRPRPYSRSFVTHLEDWYAQAHPDEDFAETFAVWLTPGVDWRTRYAGWKALEKLEYVDALMQSLAGQPPVVEPKFREKEYSFLNLKLKTYYARKRKAYAEDFPDFFDRDLQRLFAAGPETPNRQLASRFLRAHRQRIIAAVGAWTGGKKYTVNQLLRDLSQRCDELALHVRVDDPSLLVQVTAYLTALVTNYLFTGKFKRTK
jgi:hypothetical protein